MPWFAAGDETYAPAPLPVGLHGMGYCVADGKFWVFGGYDPDWNGSQAVYSFNPLANEWETNTPLSDPIAPYAAFAAIGTLIYGLDDWNEQFFSYNITTGTRTNLTKPTGYAWTATGYDLVAHDGKVYWQLAGEAPEVYDPTAGTWSAVNAMPDAFGATYGNSVSDGTHLWVHIEGQLWRYDPDTDSWTGPDAYADSDTDVNEITEYAAAAYYEGEIVIIGGGESYVPSTHHLVYNIAGDEWRSEAALPTARVDLAAGIIDGRLYAAGGVDGSSVHTAVHEMFGDTAPNDDTLASLENTYHVLLDSITGKYANTPAVAWLRNTYNNPTPATASLPGAYDTRAAAARVTNRYGNITPPTIPARALIEGRVKTS